MLTISKWLSRLRSSNKMETVVTDPSFATSLYRCFCIGLMNPNFNKQFSELLQVDIFQSGQVKIIEIPNVTKMPIIPRISTVHK